MTPLKLKFIDHALYQHFINWFKNYGHREFEEYMIGETGVNGIEVIITDNESVFEISNEWDEGWGFNNG